MCLVFKEKKKKVETKESTGGHILVNLELFGKWKDSDRIYLVEKEDDVRSDQAIKNIYKILNYNSKEQMIYAYRNAGKLYEGIRKRIIKIVDKCEICKKNNKSQPKPAVGIPKATDFNSIVAIDLKVMGEKYILWMICACTRFIQGKVLNDKKPESIVRALHRGWYLPYGYPTVGFWSDNGGELRNSKMEKFVNKLGIKSKFTPAYSPWSNRIN